MANKGKRMVFEDEYTYLQELIENHSDPSAEWGGSGSEYTAGDGISISSEDVISIDNTVALKSELFSGDYDDLTDKPDLSIYAESSDLATVATTGDYDDLTNKPTIPTNYVTTDTQQNITAQKKFTGGSSSYTSIDNSNVIVSGGLGSPYTSLAVNGLTSSSDTSGSSVSTYKDSEIIHDYTSSLGRDYKLTFTNNSTTPSTKTGEYTFKYNKTGEVAVTSEIPTTATSSSSVTPTTSSFVTSVTPITETLTFTYSDNTTANITIVTGLSVGQTNAVTSVTVNTTTTLS